MLSKHLALTYDLWMAASVGSREAIAQISALVEDMQQRIAALEAPVTMHTTSSVRGMPHFALPDEQEEEAGIIALRAALALHVSHLDETSGPLITVNGDIDPLLKRIQWQVDVLNVYRQAAEEMLGGD